MVGWPYNKSIDETKLDSDSDSIKLARPTMADTANAVVSMRTFDTAPTFNNLGTVSSGTATLNIDTHNAFKITIGGDMTFALSGTVPTTQLLQGIIEITNGGAHTITWSSYFKFVDGIEPDLTAAGTDLLSFISFGDSSTVHVLHIGRDQS